MLAGLLSQLGNIRTPDFAPPSGGQLPWQSTSRAAPQGGWLSLLSDLGNQYSQASREQDIYNVMDASQAMPLINQQRQADMTQREVDRQNQQRQSLQRLAAQGMGENPIEYLQKVAAITGDMSPITDYIGVTMGSGRPALLKTADDYLRAKETGDLDRVQTLEMFGKIFDKGVVTQQGMGGMPTQTPDFMPPPIPAGTSGAGVGMEHFYPEDLPPIPQDVLDGQYPPSPSGALSRGGLGVLPGYADAASSIDAARAGASERAKLQEQLYLEPRVESAKLEARWMEEGRQVLPKQQRALQSAERSNQNINRVIGEARKTAEKAFTTGFTGSIAGAVPGTPAYDLRQNLNTLRANAAFGSLQDMRDNSPTGGALGQVSERELDLLESAYTNLSNSQSYGQFMQNLSAFEAQNNASLQAMRQAYEEDYQRFGGQSDSILPRPSHQPSGSPAQGMSRAEITDRLISSGIPQSRIDEYLRARGL